MADLSRVVSVDEITSGLFVGNMACVESESALKQLGITAVVSVVSKYRKQFPQSSTQYSPWTRYLHPLERLYDLRDRHVIYVDDRVSDNVFRHFEDACEFIDYKLREASGRGQVGLDRQASVERRESGRVLVHCTLGISRSTTIVAAYIMWRWGFRASQALQYVKKKRSATSPNDGFIDQLLVWEELRCNPWLSRRFHIRPQTYYDMVHRLENYKRIHEMKKAIEGCSEETSTSTRDSHRTRSGTRAHRVGANIFRYSTRAKH